MSLWKGLAIAPGPAKTNAATIQLEGNPRLGVLAMIVATLFFSFQDGVTKTLIVDYSIWQLVFIRFSVLLLAVFAASFVTSGPLAIVRSAHAWFQVSRGVMLISEIVLIGLSFRYLGLAEAMTIFHLFPLMGVVMAVLILKERLNVTTFASLLLGLVGLIIAVAPGTDSNYIGVC